MIVSSREQYEVVMNKLSYAASVIGVDCETEPFIFKDPLKSHSWQLKLVGVGVSCDNVEAFIPAEYLDAHFVRFLQSDDHKLVFHNAKFDLTVLQTLLPAVDLNKVQYHDTLLLSWLLDENRVSHALKDLAVELLGAEKPKKFKDLKKQGEEGWFEELAGYCIQDCRYTVQLFEKFWNQMTPNLEKVYWKLELPLSRVIMRIERKGVKLDVPYLEQMRETIAVEKKALMEELKKELGDINLNSPKQLREFFFDKKGFTVPEAHRTEKGLPSTNADALEYLLKTYKEDWIAKLLRFREVEKIDTTYVSGLLEQQVEGTVYGSFNQTGTVTGRFSSNKPNLQNIPRGDSGFDIRRAFVARPGKTFIISDYSQAELRLVAWFANDQTMLKFFEEDKDVHQATADLMGVTRKYAKILNFGIIYGKTPFGLAQDLEITKEEAEKILADYFGRFPKVKAFMDNATRQLKLKHEVETIIKRKRRFPEYVTEARLGHASAVHRMERQAGNSIIQGSCSDVLNIAMRNLHEKLDRDSSILLTIHDELVVETPEEKADETLALVKGTMESAVNLGTVVMKADPKISPVWVK